ncbi:MAG TPA: mechanosensitive ion channel domain-containing protein [Gaiellaceae bacterium]|nr:mechanosensitive ion channel domain-containing protein [Gaiellaceae bacterium]
MSEFWQHVLVAGIVVLLTLALARLLDRALVRRLKLSPDVMTRYSVVRRTIVAAVVVVGGLSALLVIPEVRAVASSILASSAVIAIIIGFAAQSTLSNVVAGILIAFTQPLRLGDQVEVGTAVGTVEEIGLIYTLVRSPEGARYHVPNTRMASDTIRNATLQSFEHRARITIPVPLGSNLERVRDILVEEARRAPEAMPDKEPVATLTQLEGTTVLFTVDSWATSVRRAGKLAADLRLAAYDRLRAEGIYA